MRFQPTREEFRAYAAEHGALTASEQFQGFPDITWDDATYVGDAYPAFSWAAATVEVEVDLDTGLVAVERYLVVEDCGVAVNPAIVAGQVRGGVAQGIGAVLLEHAAYDEDGQPQAGTFMDYLMPSTTTVPLSGSVVSPSRRAPMSKIAGSPSTAYGRSPGRPACTCATDSPASAGRTRSRCSWTSATPTTTP